MNRIMLLKKTMILVKKGDPGAFENFYILTVQEAYRYACSLTENRKNAESLVVDAYLSFYQNAAMLPIGEEELLIWIQEELNHISYKKLGVRERNLSEPAYGELSEERAATLWLRIEEQAGFRRHMGGEDDGGGDFTASYWYSAVKIAVSILMLIATGVILFKGWNWFSDRNQAIKQEIKSIETETEPTSLPEIVITEDLMEPGWERRPGDKLYYVKKDGTLADGAISIGKQLLTFSHDGELTLIGSQREVSARPGLSFDEDTRYELKNGDIYKKTPEGQEECIIRNGHIVQMDARCGYLWYIGKYQVPNSEQVKTTIYRADLLGEGAEELYSTDDILETEHFQIAGGFLYFISDGTLFRKSFETGLTELMAEQVEYYFAWEDMVYYMKDRTLEFAFEGIDYSDVEAGYQIRLNEDGLMLLDLSGNPVVPDENGEIYIGDRIYRLERGVVSSVRPAPRVDGDVVYYIDDAGQDKKIYWKNSYGSRGLIRQEGLAADSLCIAGDWLYFSARAADYGAAGSSQLYRLDLQSMELEAVGNRFQGYIRNLYYFESEQKIYGEYLSIEESGMLRGRIVSAEIGGGLETVDDLEIRPSYEGNDMLELVMVSGGQIYCYYHRCSYDRDTGWMDWESSEPLVLGKIAGSSFEGGEGSLLDEEYEEWQQEE